LLAGISVFSSSWVRTTLDDFRRRVVVSWMNSSLQARFVVCATASVLLIAVVYSFTKCCGWFVFGASRKKKDSDAKKIDLHPMPTKYTTKYEQYSSTHSVGSNRSDRSTSSIRRSVGSRTSSKARSISSGSSRKVDRSVYEKANVCEDFSAIIIYDAPHTDGDDDAEEALTSYRNEYVRPSSDEEMITNEFGIARTCQSGDSTRVMQQDWRPYDSKV
jgi:hypothetical protein